ncbi:MAG: CHASE2 domain-containing protein [Pleurocapsa sp. SU_5_0]|nr:CHASE2 domain-containing protein [Pleurocapsa sp. SU_5_0]
MTVAIISLVILNWSQILLPLELNIYDFSFWLRPLEKNDERVVIVKWDDENISTLKETTISDRTLSLLLKKLLSKSHARSAWTFIEIYQLVRLPCQMKKI